MTASVNSDFYRWVSGIIYRGSRPKAVVSINR